MLKLDGTLMHLFAAEIIAQHTLYQAVPEGVTLKLVKPNTEFWNLD